MTSRTSSPKFSRLLIHDWRKNRWLFGLSFLGIFLSILICFYQNAKFCHEIYYVGFYDGKGAHHTGRMNMVHHSLSNNGILVIALLVLAVGNGIYLVSRYYDRRKMDFYFSFPVKRRCWYMISLIEGMLNAIIPCVLCMLGLIPVLMSMDVLNRDIMQVLFTSLAYYMIFYVSTLGSVLFAASISGHAFYACVNTVLLMFYIPALTIVWNEWNSADRQVHMLRNLRLSSPITMLVESFYQRDLIHVSKERYHFLIKNYDNGQLWEMVVIAIVTVVAGAIAFSLRGAEDPKTLIVQPKLKIVAKTLLLAHIALVIGILQIFNGVYDNIAICILSFVIGMIVFLYLIETVMENDAKAPFRSLRKQIPYVAVCTVVISRFIW